MEEAYVIVTTEFKGVFFGKLSEEQRDEHGWRVTLEGGRNCIYWDTTTRGFLGLASTGPSDKCRIGRAVPRLRLEKVTSVADCTPEAVAAWEREPWS